MAYTFDELFTLAPPYDPATQYLTATATIIIAQEDGRCAYSSGSVGVDPATQQVVANATIPAVDPAFGYYMYFSDRLRFTGNADEIGLLFRKGAPSGCDLKIILWQWGGGSHGVHLELPPNPSFSGKLYTGWGQTIGVGAGQALYGVSFNNLAVREIVLL